jgi:hypothetical protein
MVPGHPVEPCGAKLGTAKEITPSDDDTDLDSNTDELSDF